MIETVNSGEWRVTSRSETEIKHIHLLANVAVVMLTLGMSGAMGVDADDEQAALAYDAGLRATFRQEHVKAITVLNRAIQVDPSLADAHYYLGMLYGARDGWNKALTAFRNATTADPAYIEAYCRVGETYLIELARVNDAVEPLERAIQMDPHHAQGRWLLGTAYFRQNRLDAAIHELQRAVELDPSSTDALYTLGLAHYRGGEIEAASLRFNKDYRTRPLLREGVLESRELFSPNGSSGEWTQGVRDICEA